MIRSLLSRVVLTSLILVPGVVLGQGISFRAEAQSVPKLIREINAEFNTNYATAKAMESDIVCVQVTDVALSELLEKIAEVSAARWVNRNGVTTLEPSSVLRNAEKQIEVDYRKSRYERQLENYKSTWEKQEIDPKIVGLLPLDKIALQPIWSSQVYAVTPTRQQAQLNRSLPNALGTQWIKPPKATKGNSTIQIGAYEDLHLVSRQIGMATILSLEATDAKGALISRTNIVLRNSAPNPVITMPESIDESKIIALTHLQREFAKLWSVSAQDPTSDVPQFVIKTDSIDKALLPQIEEIIADPLNSEPLSIFVSPLLNEASRLEGRDLVALLPDAALLMASYVDNAETMESTSALRYLNGTILRSSRQGQWTLTTPALPHVSRSDRMNRETLKTLVYDAKRTGSLDPVALTDVLPSEPMSSTFLIDGYIGYFDVNVARTAKSAFSSQFSTYYVLSTVQRQTLTEALKVDSVTIDQPLTSTRKAVTKDIFDRRLTLVQIAPLTSIPAPQAPGKGSQNSRKTLLSPPMELTDLLPNGLTTLEMEISMKSTTMVQGRNLERGLVERSSVMMMAWAAANADRGTTNAKTDGILVCDEFMPIDQKYWTITYKLADGITTSTTISWIEPDMKIGWTRFASLGSNIVNEYNSAYQGSVAKLDSGVMQKKAAAGSAKKKIPPPQ